MKKYLLLMSLIAISTAYAENSIRLDETVISTTGFETKVKDEVKNINVITKQDIQKKNYSSVEEVLKDSPFVQTVNTDYGVIFDLRGQGNRASNRVKILVDGIPVNMMNMLYGTECAFPVNNIPVDQIEKIEIVPGGGGVLYGNGASGGFINIVTTNKTGNYAVVDSSYGSYDNRKLDTTVGVQLTDKLSANLSYSGRNSNGYRDNEKTQSDNLTGIFNYQLADNQKLTLKLEKYSENYRKYGSLTRKELNEDRRQTDPDNFRDGHLNKENYLIGHAIDLGNLEISTNAFIENSHDKQLQNVDKSLSTFWTKEKKTGANIKGKYAYSKGDLILGYDFLREEANSYGDGVMGGNRYDISKDTNSLYILNRYNISDKLQFNLGLRGEFSKYDLESNDKQNKRLQDNINLENYAYEASLNYLYSDTGNTYIKYERSFTTPTPNEFFDKRYKFLGMGPMGPKYEAFYVINNLKEEKTDNFEIGVKDVIGNAYFAATAFYSQTADEISKNSEIKGKIGPVWEYENLDQTKRYGVELYSEQYFDKLTLNQSITYIDAEISKGEKKGEDIPYVSKWRGTLGANYQFTEKLSSDLVANYYSKSFNGWTTPSSKKPARDKGYKNGYITVDWSARYAFENGLTIIGGVNNIFNEKYYLSQDDGAEKNFGSMMKPDYRVTGAYIPAPERNYYIGFRYEI